MQIVNNLASDTVNSSLTMQWGTDNCSSVNIAPKFYFGYNTKALQINIIASAYFRKRRHEYALADVAPVLVRDSVTVTLQHVFGSNYWYYKDTQLLGARPETGYQVT